MMGHTRPSNTSGNDLRPLERRIARLADEGVDELEIAWRFRKSPRFVRQVQSLAERDTRPGDGVGDEALRPLERRLLRWRDLGFDHEELAPRFRRTPEFLSRVEEMARYKLARR